MQKVLVAGGAGFIGSHLCKKLLDDGFEVFCVDNLLTGDRTNIKDLENNPSFHYIQADIVDLEQLQSLPSEIDYIFHLASPASPNAKSPKSYIAFSIETMLVNSTGTYNLLELARKNGSQFLFASTSEVYGDPEVSPQSESYVGHVNPNGIRSVYDEAKRFGEAMTMAYFRKHNCNVRIIRIFNTYGPHMQKDDGRVVSNFINQAIAGKPITIYGDGSQTRSFCYVSDMVEGIAKAMFASNTNGQVINLGNPDERTIKELAEKIKNMVHSDVEIVFENMPLDDPKKRRPDITKAQKILGWSPQVELDEGLSKTIEYFKSL